MLEFAGGFALGGGAAGRFRGCVATNNKNIKETTHGEEPDAPGSVPEYIA